MNGDYLRTLTTLQDRTPLNSELAKQLASEKVKLLQGDPGTNANIINSTWIWWGGQTITFQNGGKVRWSNGQTWTWEPGSDANTIKGETTAHQPFTITFNPDFKTGMIQGAVNGETHRVQK